MKFKQISIFSLLLITSLVAVSICFLLEKRKSAVAVSKPSFSNARLALLRSTIQPKFTFVPY